MTFADLAADDGVFIDANTFIYHCTLDPTHGATCTDGGFDSVPDSTRHGPA